MKQILKHSFEAVSLLSTDNGLLKVTIIPAMNQPDWLVPSSLILSIEDHQEHIWNYLWQQQEVAVFHLLPRDQPLEKIIILEGNTAVHRIALQTTGELEHRQVRISEVKDIELPEQYIDIVATSKNAENDDSYFNENVVTSYLFQTVVIDDTLYLIPDIDKIAHYLVDLDR